MNFLIVVVLRFWFGFSQTGCYVHTRRYTVWTNNRFSDSLEFDNLIWFHCAVAIEVKIIPICHPQETLLFSVVVGSRNHVLSARSEVQLSQVVCTSVEFERYSPGSIMIYLHPPYVFAFLVLFVKYVETLWSHSIFFYDCMLQFHFVKFSSTPVSAPGDAIINNHQSK